MNYYNVCSCCNKHNKYCLCFEDSVKDSQKNEDSKNALNKGSASIDNKNNLDLNGYILDLKE